MIPRRFPVLALLLLWLMPVQAKETRTDSLRAYVLKKRSREAYGVYVRDKKIGWFIDEMKLGTYAGKEAAVHLSEGYIATTSDGEKSVLRMKETTYFSLEGEGAILFMEDNTREDQTETLNTAVREGKELVITTRSRDRKTTRRVPLPKETLSLMRRLDRWLEGNPRKGDTFENHTTSLDQARVDVKEEYTFQEKKKILWGGVPTDVYLVRIRHQGAHFDAVLKGDGTVLRGKIGGLFELRAEKEAAVRKLDGGAVDLLAASSVPADKRLGPARRVTALTLEVGGLGDFILPQSHRERVKAGANGAVLVELKRDGPVARPQPLTAAERAEYLEATPSVQSGEAKIKTLARKIVGSERDPVKVSRRLERWVYRNLRQTLAANASTALDVLDNKAGDCTEHTLLFVTLARAAGIPAREVGGLAYLNAPRPLFGWHAWAEIHDGRQWVTVDPTWDEVYVDATHIKFQNGSEDLAFVNVVGKLKFKVVSFERAK